jgi:hypothetical protein
MMQRVFAAALVFVMLGAPAATAICQATCATTDAAHATHTATHHHSCHGESPSGTAFSTGLHLCGHLDQLPIGRDQARQELVPPAVVVLVAVAAPMVLQLATTPSVAGNTGPPSFVALAAPLRI